MKKNILLFIVTLLTASFFAACGGSEGGSASSGSAKKLAKNEILGDMPNAVYQHYLVMEAIDADKKANKIDVNSEKDLEKQKKLNEKYKALKKEEEGKFKATVEKIKAELVGKEVPFELEKGIGYEVTSCKITNVEGKTVHVAFEVKVTDLQTAHMTATRIPDLIVSSCELDKTGAQIGSNNGYHIELSERAVGATGKATSSIIMNLGNAEQYVDFAKILFKKNKP
ncbi:hypothetical protein LJB78_00015 [Bacteroidales bacterium OttesenSCG-928-J16]|nr:hypothetical protein [Bacteroidales bacterium OttesenSCG-928-J16]